MSTSEEICPDVNATECLLRALLDAHLADQKEFNWDPVSVYLTGAIGLLALVVAVLTVFQGVLAAGPGRLKASPLAIGSWAKYSTTRFSRAELRFRSVAKTPYFTTSTFDNLVDSDRIATPERLTWAQEVFKKLKRSFLRKPLTTKKTSRKDVLLPASWHVLLDFTNLLEKMDDFPKVSSYTDYLPADLHAPPAYADVLSISVLALASAAGGTRRLKMEQNYPRVDGKYAQLSFRDHPQLGYVAVYQRFPDYTGKYIQRLDLNAKLDIKSISTSVDYALGYLKWMCNTPSVDTYNFVNFNSQICQLPFLSKLETPRFQYLAIPFAGRVFEGDLHKLHCLLQCTIDLHALVCFPSNDHNLGRIIQEAGIAAGILPYTSKSGKSSFVKDLTEEFRVFGVPPGEQCVLYRLGVEDYGIPWLERALGAAFLEPHREDTFDLSQDYRLFEFDEDGTRKAFEWAGSSQRTKPDLDSVYGDRQSLEAAVYTFDNFLGIYARGMVMRAYCNILHAVAVSQGDPNAADLFLGPDTCSTREMALVKKVMWFRAACVAYGLSAVSDSSELLKSEVCDRIVPIL